MIAYVIGVKSDLTADGASVRLKALGYRRIGVVAVTSIGSISDDKAAVTEAGNRRIILIMVGTGIDAEVITEGCWCC